MNPIPKQQHPSDSATPEKSKKLSVNEEDIIRDWNFTMNLLSNPGQQLEPYQGNFIVIYEEKIIAHGTEEGDLRDRIAEELRVHPEQLVVTFIDDEESMIR